MKTLSELKAESDSLRKKIQRGEEKHFKEVQLPELKNKYVGKCFRYRNSYSCPNGEEDRWWLYTKVLSVDSNYSVTEDSFETDKYGYIEIKLSSHGTISTLGEEIPEKEYKEQFARVIKRIQIAAK